MAKFMRRGKTKVKFCPSIASTTLAPTVAELTSGTDLTNEIAEMSGFNSKSTMIDIPNFGSRQTPKIAGEQQSDDSSITIYEDDTTNPLQTTLARDVNGYIVIAPAGVLTASSKVDVFPVSVASNTRQYTSGNEAAKIQIDFAVTAVPAQDIAILT